MFRRTLQVALLAIILMANLSCESQTPKFPPNLSGMLAMTVDLEDGYQVFLLKKEDKDVVKLPDSTSRPCFDRAGENLYYTHNMTVGTTAEGLLDANQITRLILETGQMVRLSDGTGNDDAAAPHPFKDLVAFVSFPVPPKSPEDKHWRIYLMTKEGKNRHLMEPGGPVSQMDPSWSPDGTKIAYVYRTDATTMEQVADKVRAAKEKEGLDKKACDLEILKLMTGLYRSTLRVYDFDTQTGRDILPTDIYVAYPSWSPRGDLIAFTFIEKSQKSIYTVRPDGSGMKGVTSGPDDDQATWTPDGKKLVFSRGTDTKTTRIICEVDLETNQVRTLVDGIQALTAHKGKIAFEYPHLYFDVAMPPQASK